MSLSSNYVSKETPLYVETYNGIKIIFIHNNSPYFHTKIFFSTVANPIYNKIMPISHGKYTNGRWNISNCVPSHVYGRIVPMAIPNVVSSPSCNEARLCRNGIFGVRII